MYKLLAFFPLFVVQLVAADLKTTPKPAEFQQQKIIEALKKDMAYLTSDELGGRGTGSPEIEKAADYLAAQFKAAGLQPAGTDGGYFQPYSFNYGHGKLGSPQTLAFDIKGQETTLKYGEDFRPLGVTAGGKVEVGVVFAGYGLSMKEPEYDDYADIDVKGKAVILIRRMPNWDEGDKPENPFQSQANVNGASLLSKALLAAKKGAVAVLFVNDRTMAKTKDDLSDFNRDTPAKIPVVQIKRDMLDKLLQGSGKSLEEIEAGINDDLKPRSLALKDVKVKLETTVTLPVIHAKNVVGTLPGAGPLADEVVVIGAHFDHVGRNENENSAGGKAATGKIHPGADDNGSGTCGLLELARRYGAMKNRQGRRLVFLAFSGEELNLFGSKHYANNPIFANDKTAVMINMDMIGRVKVIEDKDDGNKKKDRLVIYGHGTGEGFEKIVDAANTRFNFKLYKEPGGNGPSDHDSFYRKKIPVLFFFTGIHRDYHTPTDTMEKVNFEGMAKVIDMIQLFADHFTTTLDRPKYLFIRGGWADPTDDSPKISRSNLPRLGIMPGNYGEVDKGVLVGELLPGKAAEKAGLKEGDLIIEIAGKEVKDMNGYMAALATQKAGVEIEIVVMRGKEKVKVKITPTAN
jgi:hypothetical protein